MGEVGAPDFLGFISYIGSLPVLCAESNTSPDLLDIPVICPEIKLNPFTPSFRPHSQAARPLERNDDTYCYLRLINFSSLTRMQARCAYFERRGWKC